MSAEQQQPSSLRRRFAPPPPADKAFFSVPGDEEREGGEEGPTPQARSPTSVVSAAAAPAPLRRPSLTLTEVLSHPVEALEELLEPGTEQRGEVVFEREGEERQGRQARATSSSSSSSAPALLLLFLCSSLVLLGLCAFWLYLHL